MIKKVYYFENPVRLSIRNQQLGILNLATLDEQTRDLDDAGFIIIDNPQIRFSVPVLQKCLEKNVTITICDHKHNPCGLFLPLDSHTLSGLRMRTQLEASKPLNKRLWQITVKYKILNQARVLNKFNKPSEYLIHAASMVRSADSSNIEATAAAYYWKKLFGELDEFKRDRYGASPNHYLNYIYSILRSQVAKCLVGSGLFPFKGIHHHNTYNAFCLADDIIEPFRPYGDAHIKKLIDENPDLNQVEDLPRWVRQSCLSILNVDVRLEGSTKPMQLAIQSVCARLAKCYDEVDPTSLCFPLYE